jgi:hypothetical protein
MKHWMIAGVPPAKHTIRTHGLEPLLALISAMAARIRQEQNLQGPVSGAPTTRMLLQSLATQESQQQHRGREPRAAPFTSMLRPLCGRRSGPLCPDVARRRRVAVESEGNEGRLLVLSLIPSSSSSSSTRGLIRSLLYVAATAAFPSVLCSWVPRLRDCVSLR